MNEIKLINTFTVKSGEEIFVTHNVFFDITEALFSGKEFTKYIVLGRGNSSEQRIENKICVLPTVRGAYNSDPTRGDVFATFSVRITGGELGDGEEISEIALCSDYAGEELTNYATFPTSIKKESGKDIYISACLRFAFTGEQVYLTAGDNELVRAFLGLTPFKGATFEIGYGWNFHPNMVMPRGAELLIKKAVVTPTLENGVITFASQFSASPYEIVLLMNGKVVIRSFFRSGLEVKTATSTVRTNRTFEIRYQHALTINSVKHGGTSVEEYFVEPMSRSFTASCPQVFPYPLKKGVILSSDFSGSFFMAKTDKEFSVYTMVGQEPVALYRVNASPSVYAICSDGSVITAGDSSITLYKFDGETVTERVIHGYLGIKKLGVLYYRGKYWVAFLTDTLFKIIEITTTSTVEKVSISSVPSDFDFSQYDYYYFNYWSLSGDIFGARGPLGEPATAITKLRTAVTTDNREIIKIHGRWVIYYDTSTKKYVVCLYEYPSIRQMKEGDSYQFVGDMIVVFNNGKMRELISYSANNLLPYSLENVSNTDTTLGTSVARAGDYMLFSYPDGEVKTRYIVPYGKIVLTPTLSSGTVTYEAVFITDPRKYTSQKATPTIKLSLGG